MALRETGPGTLCLHGWCQTVAACVSVHVEQKDMPEERMICASR